MEQSFFNKNAFEMCVWSYEEKNRIKARKIYQVALQMEKRYRNNNGIPQDATRLIGTRMVECASSELSAKIMARSRRKVSKN